MATVITAVMAITAAIITATVTTGTTATTTVITGITGIMGIITVTGTTTEFAPGGGAYSMLPPRVCRLPGAPDCLNIPYAKISF